MKNILVIMGILTMTSLGYAGQEKGGGDETALEFKMAMTEGLIELKNLSLPGLGDAEFQKISEVAAKIKVLVVDTPLVIEDEGVRQESIATNQPDKVLVIVSRPRWEGVSDRRLRQASAVHEILSLAHLESTGVYTFSHQYLASYGYTCVSDVCAPPRIEIMTASASFAPGNFGHFSLVGTSTAAALARMTSLEVAFAPRGWYCAESTDCLQATVIVRKSIGEPATATPIDIVGDNDGSYYTAQSANSRCEMVRDVFAQLSNAQISFIPECSTPHLIDKKKWVSTLSLKVIAYR